MGMERLHGAIVKGDDESLNDIIERVKQQSLHQKQPPPVNEVTGTADTPITKKAMRGAEIADYIHHKKLQNDY